MSLLCKELCFFFFQAHARLLKPKSTWTKLSKPSKKPKSRPSFHFKLGSSFSSSSSPIDSFRRYSRDSVNHKNQFNSYAGGSKGGAGNFKKYADSVNVPHLGFNSYLDDSNGRFHRFTGYSEKANAGRHIFSSDAVFDPWQPLLTSAQKLPFTTTVPPLCYLRALQCRRNPIPATAGPVSFLTNLAFTAFHAVDEAKKRLRSAGYEQVLRGRIGNWKLVAKGGFSEVGVQTYGSGLWHTWFDRDLTIAGRVIVTEEKDDSVSCSHKLVRIEVPVMRIPTLAIHLDRDVKDAFKVNARTHLLPVLAMAVKAELNKVVAEDCEANSDAQNDGKKSNEKTTSIASKHHSLVDQLRCEPEHISDFELQACDTQPSIIAGAAKEFIFSGRFDNLCMSFCSLKALIDATFSDSNLEDESGVRMVAWFDHEEVGSNFAQGAGSPAMLNTLSRITSSFTTDSKLLEKAIQKSFLVSADMAHALHPNYMDKQEENHQPKLQGGLAIKHNANQHYGNHHEQQRLGESLHGGGFRRSCGNAWWSGRKHPGCKYDPFLCDGQAVQRLCNGGGAR
ncbi:hypothetical protein ACFX2C_042768 [Malus domestica]